MMNRNTLLAAQTARALAAALGKMKKLPPPPTSGNDSLPIIIDMTIMD